MEQHHRTSLGLLLMFVIYCQDFRNSRASVWGKQWPQLRGAGEGLRDHTAVSLGTRVVLLGVSTGRERTFARCLHAHNLF